MMAGHSDTTYFCPFCEAELAESAAEAECVYCGIRAGGDWVCRRDHYICEACRLASPQELIAAACAHTRSADPREIADLIMRHPSW